MIYKYFQYFNWGQDNVTDEGEDRLVKVKPLLLIYNIVLVISDIILDLKKNCK